MKKLLALALTLVLALGLLSPAVAAEMGVGIIGGADGPTEVFVSEDLVEDEWQEDAWDPYADYEAAHPEEIAALDIDALVAGWGYQDKTALEQFMEDWGNWWLWMDDEDPEATVKEHYIENRLDVEARRLEAQEYKKDYPEEWAAFDADRFFDRALKSDWGDEYAGKEAYMAYYNILTEEEFADYMFVKFAQLGFPDLDDDPWWEPILPAGLTLYVNGEATEVEVTAEDGVTYADADALRQFFGPEAVPADQTGLLPIRATAEAAGWDVEWYNGWWNGQEVQLWDRAGYEAALEEEFAPLNGFLAQAMTQSMELLFSEKAISGRQTVDVDLTRFSTLNGDKKYTLTLALDYTVQNGVMDMTLTFDVSQLLQLFDGKGLTGLTEAGGFTVTQLTQLLKAGKAELIIDYNEGLMAYNVPLLALFDESQAGWQSQYIYGLDSFRDSLEELDGVSFASISAYTPYENMVVTASYLGVDYATEQYTLATTLLGLLAGKDRFSTQNGKTTYTLTAEAVNEAVSRLAANNRYAHFEETPQLSLFKACELTYTLDAGGNVTMSLHIRPDTDGIAEALDDAYDDFYDGGFTDMTTVMKWLLPAWDMDITASASGNQARSTEKMDVHWNNVGKLSLRTTATTQATTQAPRQVADVAEVPELQPWQQLLQDMLEG